MKKTEIQNSLDSLYQEWKSILPKLENFYHNLAAPLLLSVTDEYMNAETKILVIGQETYGWEWTNELQNRFPQYPDHLPYGEVFSMHDFVFNHDSVEALCWGYHEFKFAERQPITYRSPFWRTFRKITEREGTAGMTTNLSRCDFNGGSILKAPAHIQEMMINWQRKLLIDEIRILCPDLCIFFTGPNYDSLLTSIFDEIELIPFLKYPVRQMCVLGSTQLPPLSYRTYHPAFLSRAGMLETIDNIITF